MPSEWESDEPIWTGTVESEKYKYDWSIALNIDRDPNDVVNFPSQGMEMEVPARHAVVWIHDYCVAVTALEGGKGLVDVDDGSKSFEQVAVREFKAELERRGVADFSTS